MGVLAKDTLALAKQSDAVLLGAVGGPRWEGLEYSLRPERALLGIREALGLYANLRPAKLYSNLVDASTLKREVVEGIDILVIRELTGGIYFGKPKGIEKLPNGEERGQYEVYTTEEADRQGCVRGGAETAQEGHLGRQGECVGIIRAVAQGGHRRPCVLSGCRARTYLRG